MVAVRGDVQMCVPNCFLLCNRNVDDLVPVRMNARYREKERVFVHST